MQDYVQWVNRVMEGVVRAWQSSNSTTKLVGVSIHEIVPALGFEVDTRHSEFDRTKMVKGVRDALGDLSRMGLLDVESGRYYKLTHEGTKFPKADLSTAWRQITDVYLDEEQLLFLKKVAEIGQEVYDEYVCVKDLTVQQIFEALDWSWDNDSSAKGYVLTKALADLGMIVQHAYLGGHIDVVPTYVGIVRATREVESQWSRIVRELLEEWETTNVDFKRELNLGRDREKAEFVRDILGLATTRSSGRRFLVIGFDDKTRSFAQPIDPSITQERLEQILHAYSEPTPGIRYRTITWAGGNVGIIEVLRNAENIPYRVKKNLAGQDGIKAGEVYVRHGSHTEAPTQRELEDLLREGGHTNHV
jgi:hypothetical protein